MTFERTTDLKSIQGVLTNPQLYRKIVNDAAPALADFTIEMKPGIQYVAAIENGKLLAIFLLCDSAASPFEAFIHFAMASGILGKRIVAIIRAFVLWAWNNTTLHLLIGLIPTYNHLCLRLADKTGFERTVIHCAAGTRRSKSFDLIQVQAARPV